LRHLGGLHETQRAVANVKRSPDSYAPPTPSAAYFSARPVIVDCCIDDSVSRCLLQFIQFRPTSAAHGQSPFRLHRPCGRQPLYSLRTLFRPDVRSSVRDRRFPVQHRDRFSSCEGRSDWHVPIRCDTLSGDISAFSINATTGALSPVAGSPFSVEPNVIGFAVDPAGTYLYAVSGSSANLWEFSIDASGVLHNLAGSPLLIDAAVSHSGALTIDPSGKYLYVTADAPSATSIYAFTLDPATGAVYPIDLFSFSITTDPAGKFVIAVSNGISTSFGLIAVFSLDGATGKLSAAGTPSHTGSDPSSLTLDPSGKFVYVADTADATISAFALDSASGALSVVAGSPFPSGGHGTINGPAGIAADAAGKYIYVCNASNDISVFTFNSQTGALTALAGSPFASGGSGPSGIAVVQKK
jgi:6-phosphogluconolactonase (cycloisomerase 2 family)